MTQEVEAELHRLCELLRGVAKQLGTESPLIEAVEKAAFGLNLAFIRGLRPEIEDLALGIGRPLSESQLQHLRSLGIDPDSNLS